MLASLGDDAKVMGGGQSLLPIMNMRLAEPAHIIDLSRVPELRRSTETSSAVMWGGGVTHQMVEDQLVPDPSQGLLVTAARGIGYRAIRSRGTVGGSLAHADSSAEWPTLMSAVDATVIARSVRGERRLPVRGFFHGFFMTALEHDEIITGVEVPIVGRDTVWGLVKANRKAGEFAESLAAVMTKQADDGSIIEATCWLGAARDVPMELAAAARHIVGAKPDELTIAELKPAVAADLQIDPGVADAHERYGLQLHTATVLRALAQTKKGL